MPLQKELFAEKSHRKERNRKPNNETHELKIRYRDISSCLHFIALTSSTATNTVPDFYSLQYHKYYKISSNATHAFRSDSKEDNSMTKLLNARFFVAILIVACISSILAFSVAANNISESNQQDLNEIIECVTTAEELVLAVGVTPDFMLDSNIDCSTEIEEYESSQKFQINRVYSEDMASQIILQYDNNMDAVINQNATINTTSEEAVAASPLDITIDSGIMNFSATNSIINPPHAKITADFVAWDIRILEENNKFNVYMTMSNIIRSFELSNENGNWRITQASDTNQIFAPDDYEYQKGTFATFEEALAFAKTLNPETNNPF